MAKEITNQKKWTPLLGIVLFVITMIWLIGGSFLLVKPLGEIGVILVELGMLAIAVIPAIINKTSLKEIFPVKKITARDFFGASMMWLGGLIIGFISIYTAGLIFPDMFNQVTGGMAAITGSSLILAFISTVICPPICEEAVTRGAILSCFRSVKKDWIIMVIIGLMFGAMHTDPIRFVNTAIFGAITAYLILKRHNILLGVMIHFFQNFFTTGLSLLMGLLMPSDALNEAAEQAAASAPMTSANLTIILAVFMILGCAAPLLIALGSHLIKRQAEIEAGSEPKGMKLRYKVIIASVLSVTLFAGGIAVFAASNPAENLSEIAEIEYAEEIPAQAPANAS